MWNIQISGGMVLYAVAGLVLGMAYYLILRKVRAFSAYAQREEGPKERVGFFLPLAAIIGLIMGAILYEPISLIKTCMQSSQPFGACIVEKILK